MGRTLGGTNYFQGALDDLRIYDVALDAAGVAAVAADVLAPDLWSAAVWKSNLQPDFNVRVIERFGPDSFAVLRELNESNRFVQKSAESTSI